MNWSLLLLTAENEMKQQQLSVSVFALHLFLFTVAEKSV